MAQFSYSFCLAMLHSFWQAAILWLLFLAINNFILKNASPLAKRNILFAALASQLLLFIFTFFIFFFGTQINGTIFDFSLAITDYLGGDNIQAVAPWVFSIYLFIITYKLIKAIYSWYHFRKQYKCGLQKPAIDLKLFTELKAHQFGIKRKVTLWLSSSIHTPVTFGFFKPVILLPVALLSNISTQQAETLILHELTHIHTNDYVLNWFLLFSDAVFFYNPFVSGLCSRIRMEREKNCDIRVMAFEYSPVLYAETLLQAERMKQMAPVFHLAAVNRKKQLLHRIRFFSNKKIHIQPSRFNLVAPLVGLLLLLLFTSVLLYNTGRSGFLLNTTAKMPDLPFSDYLVSDADFGKNIIHGNKEKYALVKEVEKQYPVIEKQIRSLEPLLKTIGQKKELIVEKADQELMAAGFAIPVAIKENNAARQIIIKEEGSGSASVKVYYLSFENGQWLLQPEWMLTTKQIVQDSLLKKTDTTIETVKRILTEQ